MNFNLKASMDCDVKNCIYVLECVGCTKYYIGESNNIRLRTNNIKNNTGLAVNNHIYNCTNTLSSKKKAFELCPFTR